MLNATAISFHVHFKLQNYHYIVLTKAGTLASGVCVSQG